MSKLTDWEVGQELVKYQDTIFETANEFKDSHPEQYKTAMMAAYNIGYIFNKKHEKSHSFKLNDGSKDPMFKNITECGETKND